MHNYYPGSVLIMKGERLSKDQCPKNDKEMMAMKNVLYYSIMGSFMYAQVCTRPDIAFVVGVLGRFMRNLGLIHYQEIKKVFMYLQGTKDHMLTQDERTRMNMIPYASAIGSIMYVMLCTRPDVSYALSVTRRYQLDPGMGHWVAAKNILKYLRMTKDVFLIYGDRDLTVEGYSDASFQSDRNDSKSQSGHVFTLNGGVVNWKSSKQEMTADSTTESKYIAASEAAKEAVWIKKFITELGVEPSIVHLILLYCDNNGAIA